MSEKKSFWKVLNTPVQDLFKKEEAEAAEQAAAASAAEQQASTKEKAPDAEAPAPAKPAKTAEASKPAKPAEATTVVDANQKEPEAPEVEEPALDPEETLVMSATQLDAAVAEAVAETEAEPEIKAQSEAKAQAPAAKATEAADEMPEQAETAQAAAAEPEAEPEAPAQDSTEKAKRKKTLWEVLNTPVQDLFTEEGLTTDGELQETYGRVLGLGRDKSDLTETEKAPWIERFRSRLARTRGEFAASIERLARGRTKVDEDMLEELEEILLQSDVGLDTTDDILDYLRDKAKSERFLPEEVLPALTEYLENTLESEPFRVEEGKLNIFLVVGVNGTGKTTTVGKIAAKLKLSGYRVMLAAGDTFRAAAIDQLAVWGTRANCPVISHHEGADAAAVVYDSIQSARAKKMDVLLIDTAGRLHNKDHLMEELSKVHRIVEREKKDDRVERVLVLDATTGQNGLKQAEVFSKSVPLDSLILTKLDGTAKGGVIFAIKKQLQIPIKLLGVGEALGDLQEFEPKAFVEALFAQDDTAEGAALSPEAAAAAEANTADDTQDKAETH